MFLINSILLGQTAYISIQDSGQWQISIDDSLQYFSDNTLIPVTAGKHGLFLQPINDKNWMAGTQFLEIFIQEAETLKVNPILPVFNSSYFLYDESNQNKKNIILYKGNRKSKRQKYVKPILLATAVASNWASFYIKRKADDYYDIYSETSNLDRMEKYYNRAADYDVYANIMLGVSAAALSVYFYYLMTD